MCVYLVCLASQPSVQPHLYGHVKGTNFKQIRSSLGKNWKPLFFFKETQPRIVKLQGQRAFHVEVIHLGHIVTKTSSRRYVLISLNIAINCKEETHSWGENSNKSEIVTKTFTKDCSSDSDCANPDLYCDGHLNCLHQCCHGNLCNAGKSLRGYLQGIIVLSFVAVFSINFPLLRESEIGNGHS